MNDATTRPAPHAAPKAAAPGPASVQNDWLKRNQGKAITVRLLDGLRLSGLLVDWDTYTVTIRVQGREEMVLLNKHSIALFMRREAADKEKKEEE
jgi:RNA chaperone Hfq